MIVSTLYCREFFRTSPQESLSAKEEIVESSPSLTSINGIDLPVEEKTHRLSILHERLVDSLPCQLFPGSQSMPSQPNSFSSKYVFESVIPSVAPNSTKNGDALLSIPFLRLHCATKSCWSCERLRLKRPSTYSDSSSESLKPSQSVIRPISY